MRAAGVRELDAVRQHELELERSCAASTPVSSSRAETGSPSTVRSSSSVESDAELRRAREREREHEKRSERSTERRERPAGP